MSKIKKERPGSSMSIPDSKQPLQKKPLSELEYYKVQHQRYKEKYEKERSQKHDLFQHNKELNEMIDFYEDQHNVISKEVKRFKRRREDIQTAERDGHLYLRHLDPPKTLIGWKSPSLDVWKVAFEEAKEQLEEDPDLDPDTFPNAPESLMDIYAPPVFPSNHNARYFEFGSKDVFAVNIFNRKSKNEVYRCTPIPKRFMRLRPSIIGDNEYIMNENDEEMLKMPVLPRLFFNEAYLL